MKRRVAEATGGVALVRRMNKCRREALAASANPSKAKRKRDIAEAFATIEHVLQDNTLTRDFPLKPVEIETPICKTVQYELANDVVI